MSSSSALTRIVVDIETDGLSNPTRVWCVACEDVDTGRVWTFDGQSPAHVAQLQSLLDEADAVIGHNLIDYDLRWLRKLLKIRVPLKKVVDTLVLSRLYHQEMEGGHSLQAWGERLKYPKLDWEDFSKYDERMLAYCVNDVGLTKRVYQFLTAKMPQDTWKAAIEVEHFIAHQCVLMNENGFPFDMTKAKRLYEEVLAQTTDLDAQLDKAFPPKSKFVRVVTPKLTAFGTISKQGIHNWYDGDDYTIFQEGCSFSLVEWVPFKPTSPKQIVERLNEAGWRPIERTKTYLDAQRQRDVVKLKKLEKTAWKVNEANLATLPPEAPEASRLLVKRLLLASRLSTLNSWFESYDDKTKSIHGTFNGIGTWTHRMSHIKPNLGNIAAKKSIKYKTPELRKLAETLGGEMRSLWTCYPVESQLYKTSWMVGTDADGIQLRILAHYMDDPGFTEALVRGDSKLGTDAHTLNQRALGVDVCKTRDTAKTFIYAWLLGAGIPKIADILGCDTRTAEEAVKRFIEKYPGLKRLKQVIIPADAKRGYFVGLDGRKVPCDSEHLMLAGYLQNGEACIMKHASKIWIGEAKAKRFNYILRNFVHDEWQTSVVGTKSTAENLGKIQASSIEQVGVLLNLKCPLKGNYKVGKDWLGTH